MANINRLIASAGNTRNLANDFISGIGARQQVTNRDLANTQAQNALDRNANVNRLLSSGASVNEIAQVDPNLASKLLSVRNGLDKAKKDEFDIEITNMNALTEGLQDTNDVEGLRNALNIGVSAGLFDQDDAEQGLTLGLDNIRALGQGIKRDASSKSFKPILLTNAAGDKRLVSPIVSNTGVATLSPFQIPEGFSISKETPQEKRAADIVAEGQEAAAKSRGAGLEGRQQSFIDEGLEAADGTAVIRRGLTLLDDVKTGGFDAVKLRAKQLFGVESADEAELSTALGKAVLSQLRSTFGAAFTEKEGARLERIEAGFGKSVEGNRRLLTETLQLLERKARRGISSARNSGDTETARLIEESLKFEFDLDDKKEPEGVLTSPSGIKFKRVQ